jgi:hypothetical protein
LAEEAGYNPGWGRKIVVVVVVVVEWHGARTQISMLQYYTGHYTAHYTAHYTPRYTERYTALHTA